MAGTVTCTIMNIGPGLMVFNTTFNNITVISRRFAFLMEEVRVAGGNHRPVASHRQTLSHNIVLCTPSHDPGFELATLVYEL